MPKSKLYKVLQQEYKLERFRRSKSRRSKRRKHAKSDIWPLKSSKNKQGSSSTSSSGSTADSKSTFSSKGKSKAKPLNTLDPIMLCELGENTFSFYRENAGYVQYNIESLVDYFLATGDFTEPETRVEFPDEALKRLDYEAKQAGIDRPSVFAAKQNRRKFEEKKSKRNALLGAERCAGELVCDMLEVVEMADPEDGELRLLMRIFPLFSDLYRQLREADSEYARQCCIHWKEFLKGPRNKRTRDDYGFLPIILAFLDSVSAGEVTGDSFGFATTAA